MNLKAICIEPSLRRLAAAINAVNMRIMKYVTTQKLSELSGYTPKAIRRKIEEGIFVQGFIGSMLPTTAFTSI